ncbi:MAG: acyltransferase [Barnesiella sp.]|nr:acyltransferase [Barnesiella sp.]
MTTNGTQRNHGLDTLRGVGILLVVMLHCGFTGPWMRGAMLWAIPLFYVVAGCLYTDRGTLAALAADKFRRLIVPFIFYALLGLLVYVAGNCLLLHQPFKASLFNILSTDRYYLPYPAALWFFMSIFWCYMFYGIIRRVSHDNRVVLALSLATGIAGWILSRCLPLPLSLDTAMSWLPAFCIGNMLRRYPAGETILAGRYWWAGLLTAAVCSTLYVVAQYNAGYCYNLFTGNIPAIIVLSLAASLGMIDACCRAGRLPLLSYMGRNSLVIFAGHQLFTIILEQGMRHLHIHPPHLVSSILLSILSIAGSIAIAAITRRYAPALIGESHRHPRR